MNLIWECFGQEELVKLKNEIPIASIYGLNDSELSRIDSGYVDVMIPSALFEHVLPKLNGNTQVQHISHDLMTSYVMEIAQCKTKRRIFDSQVYLIDASKLGATVAGKMWDKSTNPDDLIRSCGFIDFTANGKIIHTNIIPCFSPTGSQEVWLTFLNSDLYKLLDKNSIKIDTFLEVSISGQLSLPWGFVSPTNHRGNRVAIVTKLDIKEKKSVEVKNQ